MYIDNPDADYVHSTQFAALGLTDLVSGTRVGGKRSVRYSDGKSHPCVVTRADGSRYIIKGTHSAKAHKTASVREPREAPAHRMTAKDLKPLFADWSNRQLAEYVIEVIATRKDEMNHIQDLSTLRAFLQHKILQEYSHPMIDFGDYAPNYENEDNTRSDFIVRDSFAGDYRVIIVKL